MKTDDSAFDTPIETTRDLKLEANNLMQWRKPNAKLSHIELSKQMTVEQSIMLRTNESEIYCQSAEFKREEKSPTVFTLENSDGEATQRTMSPPLNIPITVYPKEMCRKLKLV